VYQLVNENGGIDTWALLPQIYYFDGTTVIIIFRLINFQLCRFLLKPIKFYIKYLELLLYPVMMG
jgi:hypothetical protein